jgi:tRNA(Arg) A34 adenosine deaminase TadA
MSRSVAAHQRFMRVALEQARVAARAGEVPVGAVVVHDKQVIARAHNRRELDGDPTAHAEVLALRRAAAALGSWRLCETTLYVTLEPCVMCAGAIVNGRVPELVYGCEDPKAGAVRTLYALCEDPRLNHRVQVVRGVLAAQCAAVLRDFFAALRGPRGADEPDASSEG